MKFENINSGASKFALSRIRTEENLTKAKNCQEPYQMKLRRLKDKIRTMNDCDKEVLQEHFISTLSHVVTTLEILKNLFVTSSYNEDIEATIEVAEILKSMLDFTTDSIKNSLNGFLRVI